MTKGKQLSFAGDGLGLCWSDYPFAAGGQSSSSRFWGTEANNFSPVSVGGVWVSGRQKKAKRVASMTVEFFFFPKNESIYFSWFRCYCSCGF